MGTIVDVPSEIDQGVAVIDAGEATINIVDENETCSNLQGACLIYETGIKYKFEILLAILLFVTFIYILKIELKK